MTERFPDPAGSLGRPLTAKATTGRWAVVRLVASIAQRVREQAASEDRARLVAQFNSAGDARPATSSGLMRPTARPESPLGRDDPLERLWSLAAKHPRRSR
jgi:hypothetical protein